MTAGAVSSWSQTAASNATADATINWAEGMAPSAVNDSARAMMASVAKWRDDLSGILITAGTSTAYTITSNQVQTSNTDGFTVQFTPGVTNAGATTLAVDSQTAKPLRFLTGIDLPSGALVSGSLYQATYRAASSEWLLHGFNDGALYGIPIGSTIDYFGSTAPNSSFVLAYGQAISRTTYATLFSLFGTTFGTGDGSTTFNVPDLRGRIIAGKDDMGGSAASRLTSTYFGVSAASVGAVGGGESKALSTSNLPPYTPSGSVTINSLVQNVRQFSSAGTNDSNTLSLGNNGGANSSNGVPFISGTGTLNGTAQGGTSAPFAVVQPTIIANKLLRII
jgi:microcystin-dependent protein